MQSASFAERVKIVAIITLNVLFSVGVIFANKHLFQDLKFTHSKLPTPNTKTLPLLPRLTLSLSLHLGATLTGIHFVATTLFSYALHALKYEKVNELDWRTIFILSSVTSASILFSNLSLLLNSVGFYQVRTCVFWGVVLFTQTPCGAGHQTCYHPHHSHPPVCPLQGRHVPTHKVLPLCVDYWCCHCNGN